MIAQKKGGGNMLQRRFCAGKNEEGKRRRRRKGPLRLMKKGRRPLCFLKVRILKKERGGEDYEVSSDDPETKFKDPFPNPVCCMFL